MVWNLEPDDLPEPRDIEIQVCNDCHKPYAYLPDCECNQSSGYTREWWLQCPDCREVFPDEDGWVAHECEGYEPDEDYYF